MLADDLKHPSDCWPDEGAWEDLRDEKKVRYYAEINRAMAERYPEAYQKLRLPNTAQKDEYAE